jgi:hypothetical protein
MNAHFFAGHESIKTLTCIKSSDCIECEDIGMNMTAEPTMATAASGCAPKIAVFTNRRLNREWKTLEAMLKIYCRDQHGASHVLCLECQELLNYANMRLDRCRFGVEKPTCAKCPVHCYQRERREQVRIIMRYSGPRILWEHPLMSLRHWLAAFHRVPSV